MSSDARARLAAVAAGRRMYVEESDPARITDAQATASTVSQPRSQQALDHAAELYAASYGHPAYGGGFEPVDQPRRARRWALSPRLALAAGAMVLLLSAAAGWIALRAPEPVWVESPQPSASQPQESPQTTPTVSASTDQVMVHVVGRVAAPGLVTVPVGARVADAITAAGGALPDADLSGVNLARIIQDGEQIVVPLPGQEVAIPPPDHDANSGGRVNVNTADATLLDTLPGVGPVLAQRIVQWRAEHGPFTSVEELGEVSGIGPAVLDRLRDAVTV